MAATHELRSKAYELSKWIKSLQFGKTYKVKIHLTEDNPLLVNGLSALGTAYFDNSIDIDLYTLVNTLNLTDNEIKFIIAHELGHLIGTQMTTHKSAGIPMAYLNEEDTLFREAEADSIAVKMLNISPAEYRVLRQGLNDYVLTACIASGEVKTSELSDVRMRYYAHTVKQVEKAISML